MQTFLPYADFVASAAVLDDRRLGKQRVETFQILRALTFPAYAWKNHSAVRMWRGFVPALVAYGLAACAAWTGRGFADTVADSLIEFNGGVRPDVTRLRVRGPGLGLAALHVSHRSALVRKEPEHYRRFFPDVPDDLPYLWPRAAFPRWPVRRPVGGALSLPEALAGLGFEAPRPGQTEAVAALRSGCDVLVAMPAGYGGSATGLLTGLMADRPTQWITPTRAGDQGDFDPDDWDPPIRTIGTTAGQHRSLSLRRPPRHRRGTPWRGHRVRKISPRSPRRWPASPTSSSFDRRTWSGGASRPRPSSSSPPPNWRSWRRAPAPRSTRCTGTPSPAAAVGRSCSTTTVSR